MNSNQTGGGPSKVGGAESREPPFSGHNIFVPWHSHTLVVRIAIHSPPSPTTHHGFRGHQKTAEASVKHLRTVCFCGNENRTGMVLPPELVGLIDYLPTLSGSVRRVVLAISAMTSSHNDDKEAVLPEQEGITWDETGIYQ